MQDWNKRGLLYEHDLHASSKLNSHAANPLPVLIGDDIYRCYFSSRDMDNRSSVGAVDIDLGSMKVLERHSKVFFEHGESGSFYSHGVSIGNCYSVGEQRYMLFMGWRAEEGEHWYGQIGRLLVDSELNLTLDCESPFMALDDEDPISLSYPWVVYHDGKYRMWYGSTCAWDAGNHEMLHVIKYAESLDGETWVKHGQTIGAELGIAQAFSRPSVFIDERDTFHMWFSYRTGSGEAYRIGYCYSCDGYKWSFPEQALSVSSSGWDNEMVEYPFVVRIREHLVMLYNGNGYGKSGFGIASMLPPSSRNNSAD